MKREETNQYFNHTFAINDRTAIFIQNLCNLYLKIKNAVRCLKI